jgi:DAACS family dicarboxylate/amino acid:cation (Na+ or H+) symporter
LFQIALSLVPANVVDAMTDNRRLLEVILFALLGGVALTRVERSRAEAVADVLAGIGDAMTVLIGMMMRLAPIGVAALVFMVVLKFGADVLVSLLAYTVVVIVALALHVGLVLLPLVRMAGRSPLWFLRATREIWVTAFSTSSSSATLPTTMRVVEQELRVPRPIAQFVCPLGATINMDGTTIYQVVAVHFVCAAWGMPLDLSASVTLVFAAMLTAIGAAGVPGGVIPLLYVVFAAVGFPEEAIAQGIALILGMDRVLDMCRSTVNVIGDAVTAVVVAKMEGGGDGDP